MSHTVSGVKGGSSPRAAAAAAVLCCQSHVCLLYLCLFFPPFPASCPLFFSFLATAHVCTYKLGTFPSGRVQIIQSQAVLHTQRETDTTVSKADYKSSTKEPFLRKNYNYRKPKKKPSKFFLFLPDTTTTPSLPVSAHILIALLTLLR